MNARDPGILIVDDVPANLRLLSEILTTPGYRPRPVPSGSLALRAVECDPPDLVLLDVNMPEMDGYEVCTRLKADPRFQEIPVVFVSAIGDVEDKLRAFAAGGVDFVEKPFHVAELEARFAAHVRLGRIRRYCKALSVHLKKRDAFPGLVDEAFVEALDAASPLHDIGNLRVPDAVLLKRGPLTPQEWAVVKTHPEAGAAVLDTVLATHPENGFVRMGADLARAHHERWDGGGYPRGLAGEAIPVAARIFTIADQYDALRSARPHKPPLEHARAVRILTDGDGRTSPAHFDPRVLDAFVDAEGEFDAIWTTTDPGGAAWPREPAEA